MPTKGSVKNAPILMAHPSGHPRRPRSLAGPHGGGLHVVHKLGMEIVGGKFQPDERLPDEATMLQTYGVSRTALREAYGKLAAKGLIIARTKVGTSVRGPDNWNMLDPDVLSWHLRMRPGAETTRELYVLRRIVEPSAAALAAHARTEHDLIEIESALAEMDKQSKYEDALVEADLRFHVAILKATHNHFIGVFSSLIHAAMVSSFEKIRRGAEAAVFKQERLVQHERVLDAIRAEDADLARRNMEQLLDDSIGDVKEALDAQL